VKLTGSEEKGKKEKDGSRSPGKKGRGLADFEDPKESSLPARPLRKEGAGPNSEGKKGGE